MVAVVGRVEGWEALGKAVSAETEPRSAAELYFVKWLNVTTLHVTKYTKKRSVSVTGRDLQRLTH